LLSASTGCKAKQTRNSQKWRTGLGNRRGCDIIKINCPSVFGKWLSLKGLNGKQHPSCNGTGWRLSTFKVKHRIDSSRLTSILLDPGKLVFGIIALLNTHLKGKSWRSISLYIQDRLIDCPEMIAKS
jgi:hypothetical protein